ncbi:hypothetical protein QFZ88_000965 [Mesorhizobium sp. YL-MeA3-2017]|nr:hypothetical protein [Mesorhizobium sp. YL-MeA3-2017]
MAAAGRRQRHAALKQMETARAMSYLPIHPLSTTRL